jgi:hypothetical protein
MRIPTILLAATTAIALSTGAVSALSVEFGGTDFSNTIPAGNDYRTQLTNAGVNSFYDAATLKLVLGTAPGARLTFSEVFEESGATSTFETVASAGGLSMSETGTSGNNDLSGSEQESFFLDLFADGQFEDLLKFTSTFSGGSIFAGGTAGFGVYFDDTKGGSEFFLALDDGGGGADDNHDDYIVKVTVAAVPLPAAAWLLLGVSGGLIAAKRRSARKAA